MRTFVTFIFMTHVLALSCAIRAITIFIVVLASEVVTVGLANLVVLVLAIGAAVVLFMAVIINEKTQTATKLLGLVLATLCLLGAVFAIFYPVARFIQAPYFGLILIFSVSWTVVGKEMCTRYVFLTQRGWTEKEKVVRSRFAKRI